MAYEVAQRLERALEGSELSRETLESLASSLVWRIGRVSEDGPVTVRVSLAGSAFMFGELPRLRTASDSDIEAAVADGSLRVEWVGARPR